MKLKPVDGRAVRDPVKGTLLPAEGAEVEMSTFWRRRFRDGDVEEVTLDQSGTGATTATTASAATVTASTSPAASTTTASTDADTATGEAS
ncbi:DUF2635 domain-containing protein [Pantoea stewartii]|uniref:DUF2635 domain-containing protein n=1 Tax=Pantoea stewartii subsp. stewartii DC283 TaxID=660596 RepID=H3RLM9_PANSE|nr:hypothetical protein DSJ_26625 [Pantoea stewartii subsp. stewartii DC283]EHT97742.1 hypothetical protein CKS_5604 [Pantoea stewartii subsp. stewartii DC283]KAB0553982.1 DUF2635 domain-containing protein [Pantoea stewartii subsp. stewartii]